MTLPILPNHSGPRRSLAREVVSSLRAAIIRGAFSPEDALVDPVLKVRFETTGRTTVWPLNGKDLVEIVNTRMALEAMQSRSHLRRHR